MKMTITEFYQVYALGKYFQAAAMSGGNVQKMKVEIKHLRENMAQWARTRKNFNVLVFNRDFIKAFSEGCHEVTSAK